MNRGFKKVVFETPVGRMVAVGCELALWVLEFEGTRGLDEDVRKIEAGHNAVLALIEEEVEAFFEGTLKGFTTPLHLKGTAFQKKVWDALITVPFGTTVSYSAIAQRAGYPDAVRAVANAIGSNRIAVAVPCHRVIRLNGTLGGYAGGIPRKEWLLRHEGQHESDDEKLT